MSKSECPECSAETIKDRVLLGGYEVDMEVCTNPSCDYFEYLIPEELSPEEALDWVERVHPTAVKKKAKLLIKQGFWHVHVDWNKMARIRFGPPDEDVVKLLKKLATAFGMHKITLSAKKRWVSAYPVIILMRVDPDFVHPEVGELLAKLSYLLLKKEMIGAIITIEGE